MKVPNVCCAFIGHGQSPVHAKQTAHSNCSTSFPGSSQHVQLKALLRVYLGLASYLGRSLKKRAGKLSKFKLLISAALELAVSIRFQNASRDSCRISIAS